MFNTIPIHAKISSESISSDDTSVLGTKRQFAQVTALTEYNEHHWLDSSAHDPTIRCLLSILDHHQLFTKWLFGWLKQGLDLQRVLHIVAIVLT